MTSRLASLLLALALLLVALPPGNARAADPVAGEGATDVVVTGMGVTAEAARKDAWRAAVLQATGGLVSAETLSRNNVLVRDEVLSYADGYVERYTELDRRVVDGLVMVDARVVVRRTQLKKRLEALLLVAPVDGASIAATITTKLQQQMDGGAMLATVLPAFQDVVGVELLGEPKILLSDGAARLRYRARLSIDGERYRAAARRLKEILDLIATEKADASGTVGEILGCEHAGADEHNAVQRGAWACIAVFDRPFEGRIPSSASGREYLLPRDLLDGLEMPEGFHRLRLVLVDADGSPVLTGSAGPCGHSPHTAGPGPVTCSRATEYEFPTTGMARSSINGVDAYSFFGSVQMRSSSRTEYARSFEFDLEIEADPEALAQVVSAHVVLDYVSFREYRARR